MLEACVVLPDGRRVAMRLAKGGRYRLTCHARGRLLVEYASDGVKHQRRLRDGAAAEYEFRSVEQLRYEFERDVADAHAAG